MDLSPVEDRPVADIGMEISVTDQSGQYVFDGACRRVWMALVK